MIQRGHDSNNHRTAGERRDSSPYAYVHFHPFFQENAALWSVNMCRAETIRETLLCKFNLVLGTHIQGKDSTQPRLSFSMTKEQNPSHRFCIAMLDRE